MLFWINFIIKIMSPCLWIITNKEKREYCCVQLVNNKKLMFLNFNWFLSTQPFFYDQWAKDSTKRTSSIWQEQKWKKLLERRKCIWRCHDYFPFLFHLIFIFCRQSNDILPFYCCCLSFNPFKESVCSPDGFVFDIKNIVPYIKKNHINPCTGIFPNSRKWMFISTSSRKTFGGKGFDSLTLVQEQWRRVSLSCDIHSLQRFDYNRNHQNVRYEYEGSRIWSGFPPPLGNVYCYEAIREMNIEAKNWNDLLTGEPFTKSDISFVLFLSDSWDVLDFEHYLSSKPQNQRFPQDHSLLPRRLSRSHQALHLGTHEWLHEEDYCRRMFVSFWCDK